MPLARFQTARPCWVWGRGTAILTPSLAGPPCRARGQSCWEEDVPWGSGVEGEGGLVSQADSAKMPNVGRNLAGHRDDGESSVTLFYCVPFSKMPRALGSPPLLHHLCLRLQPKSAQQQLPVWQLLKKLDTELPHDRQFHS